jgi:hypothetical protein
MADRERVLLSGLREVMRDDWVGIVGGDAVCYSCCDALVKGFAPGLVTCCEGPICGESACADWFNGYGKTMMRRLV